ncbi:hypothetical protein LU298_08730 [Komagataeibacter intermedius]|uniref:Uncharacterized protein n=2 Tax=Komagataeibacter intermedius TaxID=66229 RepID=A0A0N1FA72_9PROT|nr:hypothetical protein [Komagataeibacter intermedius]KPH87181.1 hypothetical protein GLUCOINTEAF2_0202283 [Komagataeibacter intermedius AF2]MCF3636587.1 hypothetical protein [Komagataeibacter intermedius]GAN86865.1 hypothetical protein Gain_0038_044 [Komagataeibacter intermedius TF2]
MKFHTYLLALSMAGATVAGSVGAMAADCNNSQNTPKWDVLGRVAQQGDCADNRLQSYRNNLSEREQALKNGPQNLKQDYDNKMNSLHDSTVGRWDNARDAEKQKLADERSRVDQKIQNGRDRLDAIRNAPKNRLDSLRNAGSEERQRWDNLKSQTGSDVSNFLGGGNSQ